MLQTYDVEYDIGWFFSLAAFVLKNSTDPFDQITEICLNQLE